MRIYEFDKCLLERLKETMDVLSWKNPKIPASQVRSEWSYFVELQVEPAGWQALWKIPRLLCEQMNIRYPTVVFGYVEQVFFKELKAQFDITAVQDENVHLPTRHEVSLEDLWPTHAQENPAINVERTADCLDQIRFFYTHVWMPWDQDNDDDINWVEKHLESRIRLCFDLRRGAIQRPLAAYIRSLIHEARYIHHRRQYLELVASDEDGIELENTEIDPELEELRLRRMRLTEMMRIHLRMTSIRSDFEMLENPETRSIYEHIKYNNLEMPHNTGKVSPRCYLVLLSHNIDKHMEYFKVAKNLIALQDSQVAVNHSLQEVLHICKPIDQIYLSPGKHAIHFSEHFNNDGVLMGLVPPKGLHSILPLGKDAIREILQPSDEEVTIYSRDDDSSLLTVDGNFKLENIRLDCRNVSHGVIIKKGNVILRNCKFIGNGQSSIQEAIVCYGNCQVTVDRCHFENFATGINISDNVSLLLRRTLISNCNIGIEVSEDGHVKFDETDIERAKKCAIYYDCLHMDSMMEEKQFIFDQLDDIAMSNVKFTEELPLKGKCRFIGCKDNIVVINNAKGLVTHDTLEYIQQNTSDDNIQTYCQ